VGKRIFGEGLGVILEVGHPSYSHFFFLGGETDGMGWGRVYAHGTNEVILHFRKSPHLAILQVRVDREFLTEAAVFPHHFLWIFNLICVTKGRRFDNCDSNRINSLLPVL
jgi:hypothetical protein